MRWRATMGWSSVKTGEGSALCRSKLLVQGPTAGETANQNAGAPHVLAGSTGDVWNCDIPWAVAVRLAPRISKNGTTVADALFGRQTWAYCEGQALRCLPTGRVSIGTSAARGALAAQRSERTLQLGLIALFSRRGGFDWISATRYHRRSQNQHQWGGPHPLDHSAAVLREGVGGEEEGGTGGGGD